MIIIILRGQPVLVVINCCCSRKNVNLARSSSNKKYVKKRIPASSNDFCAT